MKRQVKALGAVAVVAVTCACLVQSAQAFQNGFTNLGADGVRTWTNNSGSGIGSGSGNSLSNGTDYEPWAGAPGTGEVSWNVDWHLTATPTRDVGHVVLYPGSRTPGHFIIYRGDWSGSMTWTPAYETTVANIGQNFNPVFLETSIQGASGLKYEVINQGNLGYQYGTSRGMANILLFGTGTSEPDRLVRPTSAVQNLGVSIGGVLSTANFTVGELAKTIDGTRNNAVASVNTGTQRSESVTYSFAQPQPLGGVFINLNPIDGFPWYWRSFEVRDLGGTLLTQSQVGPTDITTSTDRYQFLAFPGGPLTLSGFTVQGLFGIASSTGNTENARMGEVWGVWVPEPSAALLLGLAALAASVRRSRPRKN